jgi:TonB-dependent starch-binding outer membrane protein SusC
MFNLNHLKLTSLFMTNLYLSIRRYVVVFLMLGCFASFAQQRTVTGRVTSSEDGSAIPGVNVLEKGTTNGTATDANGNYSIQVNSGATLVFTFVGYANTVKSQWATSQRWMW